MLDISKSVTIRLYKTTPICHWHRSSFLQINCPQDFISVFQDLGSDMITISQNSKLYQYWNHSSFYFLRVDPPAVPSRSEMPGWPWEKQETPSTHNFSQLGPQEVWIRVWVWTEFATFNAHLDEWEGSGESYWFFAPMMEAWKESWGQNWDGWNIVRGSKMHKYANTQIHK